MAPSGWLDEFPYSVLENRIKARLDEVGIGFENEVGKILEDSGDSISQE
jgi:hypothetical protein